MKKITLILSMVLFVLNVQAQKERKVMDIIAYYGFEEREWANDENKEGKVILEEDNNIYLFTVMFPNNELILQYSILHENVNDIIVENENGKIIRAIALSNEGQVLIMSQVNNLVFLTIYYTVDETISIIYEM